MSDFSTLEPKAVWEIFEEITKIPRPSKREEKIIAWLIELAKSHSLDYKHDKAGNVVIYKGATQGYEDKKAVILQSHVDMVCEKNSDVDFDFDTDPIKAYIDGDYVRAEGTTLGADCGIGMAAALAVLTDNSLEHPAIEALFTVDEETGLTGAHELDSKMISGRTLINLDSEEHGELCIGCSGGIDSIATLKYKEDKIPANYSFFRVDVNGLQGGHSGEDIGKKRGNANKILFRLLMLGQLSHNLRLSYVDGGNLRNAIPREAYAIFGIPTRSKDEFMQGFDLFISEMEEEHALSEPTLNISINDMPEIESVMDIDSQRRLIVAVVGVVNGVVSMSQKVEGLVESSTNLASIKFKGDNSIVITTSQRSAIDSAKIYVMQMVESIFWLAGADVAHSDGYPGWSPNLDSKLLALTKECYSELFNGEAKVKAIHAGLECGLFLERFPELDMISFGPTIEGVHSPDERLNIATVGSFYRLLTELLRRL